MFTVILSHFSAAPAFEIHAMALAAAIAAAYEIANGMVKVV